MEKVNDTDIELKINLNIADAEATTEQLKKEIQSIFESRSGEQSAALTNLEAQMKQALIQAEQLKKEISEAVGTKVSSSEYTQLNKEYDRIQSQTDALIQKMKDFEETGGDVTTRSYQNMALKYERLEAQMIELEEKRKDMRAKGQDTILYEESEQFKHQSALLDKIDDQLVRQIIRHREIEAHEQAQSDKLAQSAQSAELKASAQEVTDLNRGLFSLTAVVRGITRMIPGASAKAVISLSMVIRGVNKLTHLTKTQLVSAIGAVKTAVAKLFTLISTHPIIAAITAIIAVLGVLAFKLKKLYDETKKQVEDLFSTLKQGLKSVGRAIKDISFLITKSFFRLGTSIPELLIKGFRALKNAFSSLKGLFSQYINLMATWNRGANEVNASLTNITAAFAHLKAALTSIVVPLIQFVEPVLARIADKLADVSTEVGLMVAKKLGMKTFQAAIKQQSDYAKSLSKTVSTLDDLNVLSSNNDAVTYHEVDVDEYTEWFSNLEDAGKALSQLVTKVLAKIPWKSVQKSAQKTASSIAKFINSFTGTGFGEAVGTFLGEGINTLSLSINTFLEDLEKRKLGEELGKILTNMIQTINWKDLGSIFSNSLNALADTIIGIGGEVNSKENRENLTQAVHDFLVGALGGIDWFSVELAFEEVVTTVVNTLNALITEDNFKLIGETLANVLKVIFNGIDAFVSKVNWGEWEESIKTAINTFFENTDWKLGAQAISKLAKGLLDTLIAAINDIKWDEVADALIDFIAGIDWKELGDKAKQISEELRKAFDKIWTALKDSGALDDLIELIVEFLSETKNWEDALDGAKKDITKDVVKKKVGNWFTELLEAITDASSIRTGVAPIILPHYATGQVIPPGMSEHLAVLGDNNKETEVVSPLSTMKEALLEALQVADVSNKTQEIVLNLDGHEFMRAMVKQNDEYKRQHGGVSAFAT